MANVLLCGAGALGSQIAMLLARDCDRFLIIDDDRVGPENLATSAFWRHHVGAYKAVVLAEMLYRRIGTHAIPVVKTLTRPVLEMPAVRRAIDDPDFLDWGSPSVIVDTFDNVEARRLTVCDGDDVVHVGVGVVRTGSVVWDRDYKVPPGLPRGENPVCTHNLGIRILRLTAATAVELIDEYLIAGAKLNAVITTRPTRIFV